MRVIVVDDEEDLRLVLRLYLEARGHEVLDGVDGAAARDLCRDQPADVLILDLTLPGEDGIQVLGSLHEAGTTPPRTYVMSALPPTQLAAAARETGATPLQKPFTIDRLDALFDW